MKSKTKIIISCGIVLFLTTAVLVWSWSTGCFDNFSVNEQQKYEDLLMILIKTSEKEHFLSQLEHRRIRYFVEKKNNKDVVFFKMGMPNLSMEIFFVGHIIIHKYEFPLFRKKSYTS